MIQQDEHIIYVSPVSTLITIKQDSGMRTGLQQKNLVVTTRRVLFFESLVHQIQQIEYELVTPNKPPKKQQKGSLQERSRVSINSIPEYFFELNNREAKLIIDQEVSCLRYFQKIRVKNLFKRVTGVVILKNMKKMRFEILAFDGIKSGFRFCKALICGKAWIKYEQFCKTNNIKPNKLWLRILINMINSQSQNSIVLIDPDLFIDGSDLQIRSFIKLMSEINFAKRFQHLYSLQKSHAAQYAISLILAFQRQTFSLILSKTGLKSDIFKEIFTGKIKLSNLIDLQLQDNQLTDQIFINLIPLLKQSKKLSNINLSRNLISLKNSNYLPQLLKSTSSMLRITLDYNQIDDHAILNIENFILMAVNPPVQQLDLSFNKFSRKGAWRLYTGHNKYKKRHPQLNFIIYPVPCKSEVFPIDIQVQFPIRSQTKNFNLHSALIQQFQQQSFMKHTFDHIIDPTTITVRFQRIVPVNVRLPKTKQQVSQALQLSNKIQNYLYDTSTVEKILEVGQELMNFPFTLPPTTKIHMAKFLNDRLNQALFIRDHYAVHYIFKTIQNLQIDYKSFAQRLNHVHYRDEVYCQKVTQIMSFDANQEDINDLLDQMVKEGLRLYLQGSGVQLIYYLKYLRNKHVQSLLVESYNPQHYIFDLLAKRNITVLDNVTERQFKIPFQIRVQKRINQNFYLHPYQTNYVALSQTNRQGFKETMKYIQQARQKPHPRSQVPQLFAKIQERINFVKNQFVFFSYHKFQLSYKDLKLNSCRLIHLYSNIQQSNLFLDIPIYINKKPITKERTIALKNPKRFKRDYHISNYVNLNPQARKFGFYNFTGVITKYQSEIFKNQVKILLQNINQMLTKLENDINMHNKNYYEKMTPIVKIIIDRIRKSIYPQELKEEFYLHIIGWRKGKHNNNTQLITTIPFLTMYLKPPLPIQKYLIASILENQYVELAEMPMCIVSDPNSPTDDNIATLDSEFIERDWLHSDNNMNVLMENQGKIQIRVQLLTKSTVTGKVPQSYTVCQLVSMLTKKSEANINDSSAFWLYKYHKQTQNSFAIPGDNHIGEIIASDTNAAEYIFVLKRRIYSPELKYNIRNLQTKTLNSIYHDLKFQYIRGEFFVDDKNAINLASIMILVDTVDGKTEQQISGFGDFLTIANQNWSGYIPKNTIKRLNLKADDVIQSLRGKISERVLKRQFDQIRELKIQFLEGFQNQPSFMSTTYIFQDRQRRPFKVSINMVYIYLDQPQSSQKIFLESLISAAPRVKYLLLTHHAHDNLTQQVALYGTEAEILSATMDILSYCVLRMRISSNNLYSIVNFQKNFRNMEGWQKKMGGKFLEERKTALKKLQGLTSTVIEMEHFIYAKKSKFIKTFVNRKLYANKSEKKMEFKQELDDDQLQDLKGHSDNVFAMIFPQNSEKRIKAWQGQPVPNMDNYQIHEESMMKKKKGQLSPIEIDQGNEKPPAQPPTIRNLNAQQPISFTQPRQDIKPPNRNEHRQISNVIQDRPVSQTKTQQKLEQDNQIQDQDPDSRSTAKKQRDRLPRRRNR